MQENNFEKQVQQKMEDLQFVPSEPVWQKVALQIGKEKRKRRLLLFLLPLLLASGGAIWYASTINNHPSTNISHQNQPNNSIPLQTQSKPQKNNTPIATLPEASTVKPDNNAPEENGRLAGSTNEKRQKGFETFLKKAEENKKEATTFNTIRKEKKNGINEELHALVVANEIEKIESVIAEQKKGDEKNVSKPFWDSATIKKEKAVAITDNDSSANDQTIIASADVAATKTDSAIAEEPGKPNISTTKKEDKQNRQWEWTVTARGGSSGLRNGMLKVFSNARADLLYASPSTGNNNPGTGSGSTGNTTPSFATAQEIEKGFAFGVGAGVRKKIFKNAFVLTGLQYSRYSTRAPVGSEVAIDTSINFNGRTESLRNYYRASGPQSTYTTHYHYLEVPLAFEYRLFKKVPLQLQHGISVGYLLASNALYFDPGARVLYKNRHWLRNTGWQLFTSVDYRLLKASNFSLFLGPQVQYSIAPLQQRQEAGRHYLFFTGIQSRITF